MDIHVQGNFPNFVVVFSNILDPQILSKWIILNTPALSAKYTQIFLMRWNFFNWQYITIISNFPWWILVEDGDSCFVFSCNFWIICQENTSNEVSFICLVAEKAVKSFVKKLQVAETEMSIYWRIKFIIFNLWLTIPFKIISGHCIGERSVFIFDFKATFLFSGMFLKHSELHNLLTRFLWTFYSSLWTLGLMLTNFT